MSKQVLVTLFSIFFIVNSQLFDTVQTKYGSIRGKVRRNTRIFQGVPFAKPPVGELRWSSPVAPIPWSPKTLETTSVPPMCPGTIQALIDLVPTANADEDCLYLNVYTPIRERISKPIPVMFWIFGGGFVLGDSWEFGLYDGQYIVENHDVIVVTANYRLGALGFAVIDDTTLGNYAIEDQRFALQWIADNIANFGGDPKNVLAFGESAGAMSIGIHLTSPLSKGLFHKAIFESNAMGLKYKSREQALKVGAKLAKVVNCEVGDIACLRNTTWQRISFLHLPVYPAGAELFIGDILEWGPTVDGINLLRHPLDSFAMGDFEKVPMIWGTNTDEMDLFLSFIVGGLRLIGKVIGKNITEELGPIAYNLLIDFCFRDSADLVKKRYPPSLREDNFPLFSEVITQYVFHCSSRRAALDSSKFSNFPVYTYEFTHIPQFLPNLGERGVRCFSTSSCHALELPYVFHPENILGFYNLTKKFTDEEDYMSQKIISYWVGFAYGDPNQFKPPVNWQTFTQSSQNLLDINPNFRSISWDTELCDFWDQVGYQY